MKTGSKSLLFGVHNVLWHPITVLIAWLKLYGIPNIKELICIIIHDWGYWGCAYMDDDYGEMHPLFAALLIKRVFPSEGDTYFDLCLLHSRHLAKKMNDKEPSKLCWADKLSICYDPCWFYLLRARLSGELKEYRKESSACGFCPSDVSNRIWFRKMRIFMKQQAINQKSSCIYMRSKGVDSHCQKK